MLIYDILYELLGGDASIIPKKDDDLSLKRSFDERNDVNSNKKIKLDNEKDADIHRTGAKCVPNSFVQDSKEKGVNYHVTGVVRLKPGRGDPTLSMSCSDKIAKWIVLGIQGSLLDIFLTRPIYLKGIIVGKCPFNYECMKRALISRSNQILTEVKFNPPFIVQSSLLFKDSKLAKYPNKEPFNNNINDDEDDLKASFNCKFFILFVFIFFILQFLILKAICWTYGLKNKQLFVLVKGNMQGFTKNSKASNYPPISKHFFLTNFKKIYQNLTNSTQNDIDKLKYIDFKKKSLNYKKLLDIFHSVYKDWVRTDQNKYYSF